MIVVSDTSPILYLLLIDQLELLPFLYRRILIPEIVRDEMLATGAPIALQQWISNPPSWLEVCAVDCSSSWASRWLSMLTWQEGDNPTDLTLLLKLNQRQVQYQEME